MIYELDATQAASTTPAASESVDVKWCATEEDFSTLSELTFVSRDAIPNNARGIIASVDRTAAGGIWVCRGQLFPEIELGIGIALTADQAWLFGARVESKFRGRGVYHRILDFATRNLSEDGISSIIVAVNPDNRASNHVHKRWSKQVVGRVFATRLVQFVFCRSSGNAKCDRTFSTGGNHSPIHVTIHCNEEISNLASAKEHDSSVSRPAQQSTD